MLKRKAKNTLVTVRELENLEKTIKKNVSFKFLPEERKGQDFIDIGMIINYNDILNLTLK